MSELIAKEINVPGYVKVGDAIISRDKGALESYKKKKEFNRKIAKLENDVIDLKEQVNNLKEIVSQLMAKI